MSTYPVSTRITVDQLTNILTALRHHHHQPKTISAALKLALNQFIQSTDPGIFHSSLPTQDLALARTMLQPKQSRQSQIDWGTPSSPHATPSDEQEVLLSHNINPTIKKLPKNQRPSAKVIWNNLKSGATSIADNIQDINSSQAIITSMLLIDSGLLSTDQLSQYKSQCQTIVDNLEETNE